MTNLEKLEQAKKAGFEYRGEKIIETYRDNWVYLEDSKGNNSVELIEWVVSEWDEHLALLKEQEEAKNGNSIVSKYFKRYGVLGSEIKKSGDSLSATIIYDGFPTPGNTWNTTLLMMGVASHVSDRNNYVKKAGKVNQYSFTFHKREDDLIDATMKNNKPHIRSCHGWNTEPHEKSTKHYTKEMWETDKERVFKDFLNRINRIITDKPIQIAKSGVTQLMYQDGSDFLFKFFPYEQPEYGWHYFKVEVTTFEIFQPGKYRNESMGISKIPKFTNVTSKADFIESIKKAYLDMEERCGANLEFKY